MLYSKSMKLRKKEKRIKYKRSKFVLCHKQTYQKMSMFNLSLFSSVLTTRIVL